MGQVFAELAWYAGWAMVMIVAIIVVFDILRGED
jgi:hypothetical protein